MASNDIKRLIIYYVDPYEITNIFDHFLPIKHNFTISYSIKKTCKIINHTYNPTAYTVFGRSINNKVDHIELIRELN